jgi:hypothetical protein
VNTGIDGWNTWIISATAVLIFSVCSTGKQDWKNLPPRPMARRRCRPNYLRSLTNDTTALFGVVHGVLCVLEPLSTRWDVLQTSRDGWTRGGSYVAERFSHWTKTSERELSCCSCCCCCYKMAATLNGIRDTMPSAGLKTVRRSRARAEPTQQGCSGSRLTLLIQLIDNASGQRRDCCAFG